jgi:hypothetical protein
MGLDLVFRLDLGELDPSLESAVRFLAANFAAMGVVMVWATGDVLARRAALRICFAALLLGAGLRLVAIAFHGMPSTMTLAVIGGELTAGGLWLWHERILRRRRRST